MIERITYCQPRTRSVPVTQQVTNPEWYKWADETIAKLLKPEPMKLLTRHYIARLEFPRMWIGYGIDNDSNARSMVHVRYSTRGEWVPCCVGDRAQRMVELQAMTPAEAFFNTACAMEEWDYWQNGAHG